MAEELADTYCSDNVACEQLNAKVLSELIESRLRVSARLQSLPTAGRIDRYADDRSFCIESADLDSTHRSCDGQNPHKLFYGPSCNGMRVVMLQVLESRNFCIAGPLNCGDPRVPHTASERDRTLIYLHKAFGTIMKHRGVVEKPVQMTTGHPHWPEMCVPLAQVECPDEWWAIALPLKMVFGSSAHMAGIVIKGGGAMPTAATGVRPAKRVRVYQIDTERYDPEGFAMYTKYQKDLLQPFFDLYAMECEEWVYSVCHQDKPQCEGWTTFYCTMSALGYRPDEINQLFGPCHSLERDMMSQLLSTPLETFREEVELFEAAGVPTIIPDLRDQRTITNTSTVTKFVVQTMLMSDTFDIRNDHPIVLGRRECERSVRATQLLTNRPYDVVEVSQLSPAVMRYVQDTIRAGNAGPPTSGCAFASDLVSPDVDEWHQSFDAIELDHWDEMPIVFMPMDCADGVRRAFWIGGVDQLALLLG